MIRWDIINAKDVDNENVDLFIEDIKKVYLKHGLTISHEDEHGAFIIENYNDENIRWIDNSMVKIKEV